MHAFRSALAEQGIDIRAGDKKGVWVAERDGELVGAIHRLVGVKAVEVDARMSVEPNLANVTPTETAVVAIPTVTTFPERPEMPPTALNPTTEPVRELRETSHPAEAPASVSHRSGAGQTAETAPRAICLANIEGIAGLGEPPGPNATPEQLARYRKRLIQYDEMKGLAWLAMQRANSQKKQNTETPTQGGGSHGGPTKNRQDAINQASARLVAQLFGKPKSGHPRRQQSRISITGADARGEGTDYPSGARQAWTERSGVVSNSSGSELGKPSGPLEPVGANRDGSQHQSDDFGSVDGASRDHRPHGEKTNHTRVQDRRFTRTLSKSLTASQSERFIEIIAKLQEAPTSKSMAREQIQTYRADIDRRLSGRPWSKPSEISAEVLAEMIQKTAKNEMACRGEQVEQARKNAVEAKSEIPAWQSVWPFMTESKARAVELEREALAIQERVTMLDHGCELRIKNAPAMASATVRKRLADVKAWEARPDIAHALEEKQLLFRVSASVVFDDDRITALLLDGRIDLAMAEERRREEAEQRHLERDSVMRNTSAITLKGYR